METQPLDSSDVAAILENVMPSQSREECQQELQHTGRTEFVYALDEYTRFRTFVHKKSGKVVLGFFSW